MLQLKPTITEFLRCAVGDGRDASFWYDSWTEFGQLITFLGETGPRQLRLANDAHVLDASRDGNWALPAARSENSQALLVALTETPAPNDCNGRDSYFWRNAAGDYRPTFSSKETWEQLRLHSPVVPWADVVWFKQNVPRFSFIIWLALLNRLPTRDRLRGWGMSVPTACVLCSNGTETHDHLFFTCPFSSELWGFFAAKLFPSPPTALLASSAWILTHSQPHTVKATAIVKLLFQTVVYHLWKERNARIFSASQSSAVTLRRSVDRTI
ncbi:PREDICTED: uncharacterized protein LOC109133514 [Camelina sativa]|uniref:Uncharacterized protein LOC109133514 n=1 Tax=Camelina sativa TaxID=90675 RepID=A0ABM1RU46_CAMSA|nr:PREDICTED: uncharacterized protein LOC109133514 [Camelina sativa]